MPRIPRKFVFDPAEVGIYHCINRCVRRAFLCGTDAVSGKCFDHRKDWIQERIEFLAAHYGIDVLGFSIMSNHIHVVVRNRPDIVAGWSDEDVARRWWSIFPQRRDRDGNPAEPTDADLNMITVDPDRLAEIRRRLSSVSWFMRCLVEPIARSANKEDSCSGRFFEGRFRCQPILDEPALAACLVYVDLNPICAGIAQTPETSRFTSVFERIQALCAEKRSADVRSATPVQVDQHAIATSGDAHAKGSENTTSENTTSGKSEARADWLSPFELSEAGAGQTVPAARASNKGCLPMSFAEYLELLDWTGRQIRADKSGAIPPDLCPILQRLNLSGEGWLKLVHDFRRKFRRAAGTPASLAREANKRGCRKMHGIVHSRAIFDQPSPRSSA
jgi:hypothetical protein